MLTFYRLRLCSAATAKMSQRASSTKTRRSGADRTSQSQNNATPVDVEEVTNDFVRFVVIKGGLGLPIKKSDVQKHLKITSKIFNFILERTKAVLKEVYGYDLRDCDGKQNTFTVANILKHIDLESSDENDSDNDDEGPDDGNRILILLILTHIFMSRGSVSEKSLADFLNGFEIEIEQQNHPVFGNIKHFITHLVKAKYLATEVEQGTNKLIYRWGSKADMEISKLEILKFVAKMFGERRIESWGVQLEEAKDQFTSLENGETEEMQSESMDTSGES